MKSRLEIDKYGTKYWKLPNGELHKEDGPAIEYNDETKIWYKNGKRHRLDNPAIEFPNGFTQWLVNGVLHREDGPAIHDISGYSEWWLNGEKYSKEEYKKKMRLKKLEHIL